MQIGLMFMGSRESRCGDLPTSPPLAAAHLVFLILLDTHTCLLANQFLSFSTARSAMTSSCLSSPPCARVQASQQRFVLSTSTASVTDTNSQSGRGIYFFPSDFPLDPVFQSARGLAGSSVVDRERKHYRRGVAPTPSVPTNESARIQHKYS